MNDLKSLDFFLSKLNTILGQGLILNVGSGVLGEAYKKWISQRENFHLDYHTSVKNWSLIQLINTNVVISINKTFVLCSSKEDIENAIELNRNAIVDPVLFSEELSNYNLNTSDLKAAYLCKKLECGELIIFTDVDGIYTHDPKESPFAEKIAYISANSLVHMGRTSLDKGMGELLQDYHLHCKVVGIDAFLSDNVKNSQDLAKLGTDIYWEEKNE